MVFYTFWTIEKREKKFVSASGTLTRQIIQLFSPKQCSLYSVLHSKYFFPVPAAVEKGASVKLDKDAKIVKTPNGVTIEIEQKWRLYYLKSIS